MRHILVTFCRAGKLAVSRQLLATIGTFWQLLSTIGNFWLLLAIIRNFGQYMSWDDMSRDKMSPDWLTMVMMRLTLVMMRLTMVMMTKHFLHSFVLYCIGEPSFVLRMSIAIDVVT